MIFSEQTYSALVVSSADKFNDAIRPMLPCSEFYPVRYAGSIASARRELLARSYDFVIVNAPLPDDFGTRFAIDASARPGTVVLLLLRGDVYEQIDPKVTSHGVFTLLKPVPAQTLRQGLKWMTSARERLRHQESKTATIEEKMEEIRLVNRAKWLLIEQRGMTEPEAHRHIEKQAMDRCVPKREIAQGIIQTYT